MPTKFIGPCAVQASEIDCQTPTRVLCTWQKCRMRCIPLAYRCRARKLAWKSNTGYFAIYPRINGQVSNITLQSILASFFRPARDIRQGKPDETLDQTQPKRKRAKFYRTAKAATPHSSSKSLSSLKQSCHPHNFHAQNQTAKRKAAFTNESCLYHYSRYSKWGNSLAVLSQLVDVLSQT